MINNNPILIYVIAAGFAILIGTIIFLGWFAIMRNNQRTAYDDQLKELIQNDNEETKKKVTIVTRWNRYWSDRFQLMGWAKYNEEGNLAGRDTFIAAIACFVVLSIVFRNPIAALALAAASLYVVGVFMKSKGDRQTDKINNQLPGFLFAMKANVQANETPERAILKVVDNMPSPLYEDLLIVKERILANSSFKEALEELSAKTASRDLKFLCACMIQAADTGSSLEKQITVIQKVLESRRKVSDEITRSIRSATPVIWVSSFVIPGSLIFSYISDPNARNFWFKQPLSWAALGAVIILYLAGVWLVKKLVDGIKNL